MAAQEDPEAQRRMRAFLAHARSQTAQRPGDSSEQRLVQEFQQRFRLQDYAMAVATMHRLEQQADGRPSYAPHVILWEINARTGDLEPTIKFTHKYLLPGELRIQIKECCRLKPAKSNIDDQSVYVSLSLGGTKTTTKTIVKGGSDPKWQEEHHVFAVGDLTSDAKLCLEVYNAGRKRDYCIGVCVMSLQALLLVTKPAFTSSSTGPASPHLPGDRKHLAWFELKTDSKQVSCAGHILLHITYQPGARPPSQIERFSSLDLSDEELRAVARKRLKHLRIRKKQQKLKLFGGSLETALELCHSEQRSASVPDIVHLCVEYIRKEGLQNEGIFRKGAEKTRLDKIKLCFERLEEVKFHNVDEAGDILKAYLREMNPPAIPFSHHNVFLDIGRTVEEHRKTAGTAEDKDALEKFRILVASIPKESRDLLTYVVRFLSQVAKHSDVNKMDASNLSRMFGPNMIRKREPPPDASVDLTALKAMQADMAAASACVCFLIEHFGAVFTHQDRLWHTESIGEGLPSTMPSLSRDNSHSQSQSHTPQHQSLSQARSQSHSQSLHTQADPSGERTLHTISPNSLLHTPVVPPPRPPPRPSPLPPRTTSKHRPTPAPPDPGHPTPLQSSKGRQQSMRAGDSSAHTHTIHANPTPLRLAEQRKALQEESVDSATEQPVDPTTMDSADRTLRVAKRLRGRSPGPRPRDGVREERTEPKGTPVKKQATPSRLRVELGHRRGAGGGSSDSSSTSPLPPSSSGSSPSGGSPMAVRIIRSSPHKRTGTSPSVSVGRDAGGEASPMVVSPVTALVRSASSPSRLKTPPHSAPPVARVTRKDDTFDRNMMALRPSLGDQAVPGGPPEPHFKPHPHTQPPTPKPAQTASSLFSHPHIHPHVHQPRHHTHTHPHASERVSADSDAEAESPDATVSTIKRKFFALQSTVRRVFDNFDAAGQGSIAEGQCHDFAMSFINSFVHPDLDVAQAVTTAEAFARTPEGRHHQQSMIEEIEKSADGRVMWPGFWRYISKNVPQTEQDYSCFERCVLHWLDITEAQRAEPRLQPQ